jgi:LPPG:FO 2-phospho-L-lactate transferase
VLTKESGELAFQEYFVHHRCEPAVSGFRFDGIETAKPAAGVLEAIREADLIVFCPSNPWVSIDPILAVSGVRAALTDKPILAVSPIIQGKTVKGPAAKMYQELGISPSARAVANHYDGLVDIFVFDTSDQAEFDGKDTKKNLAADILMKSSPDQLRLAREVIEFYDRNMNDR